MQFTKWLDSELAAFDRLDAAESGGPPVLFSKRADGSTFVEFHKQNDDGSETVVLANEGGLELARSQVQTIDIDSLIAEVCKRLDVPTMISKAVDAVRAELDLVEINPAEIVRVYAECIEEASK